MHINKHTNIAGPSAVLVPYRKEHVPQYNAWMQDPLLLELTASEPLTLEEEYENQISWQEDDGKLTFIILDSSAGEKMVGDVNLFLSEHEDEEVVPMHPRVWTAENKIRSLSIRLGIIPNNYNTNISLKNRYLVH